MNEKLERRDRVVVVGGGNGGLSVAGRLRRRGIRHVTVIEPRDQHVFAPLQSHIAGGVARASEAVRPQASVTPRGVAWLRDRVVEVDPHAHAVVLASGDRIEYDHLVIAAGLDNRYDAVPGLQAAMDDPAGLSSYTFDLAAKTSPALRDFQRGTVVFVQQPEPASAAGVAQKPMYLACDWWRAQGRLEQIRVVFVSPEPTAFSIPAISAELLRTQNEYGIQARYRSRLVEVRPDTHELLVVQPEGSETISYDLLVAAPPQSPPDWIAGSGLADSRGFVDIDPSTLRSRRFPDVWSLGDSAAVDTLRSGGAIRRQSKVLTDNLIAAVEGRQGTSRYDGYTVCPITVTRRTVVFAEFDKYRRLAPTVPGWDSLFRERRLSYLFDRHILPWVYWHLILQGRA